MSPFPPPPKKKKIIESFPSVESIYDEDKHLCWERPQTLADIVAYYIKIFSTTVLWYGHQTTGTCTTPEDMVLDCLTCGSCHVNITVEFREDSGVSPRNGSTSELQLLYDDSGECIIVSIWGLMATKYVLLLYNEGYHCFTASTVSIVNGSLHTSEDAIITFMLVSFSGG